MAPAPALSGPAQAQWNAAVQGELTALKGEEATESTIAANYDQAGIHATVASALPPANPADILKDSLAQAAENQMQANYGALGSMDLTSEQIQAVYGSAINAASHETGVPVNVITYIIWNESKGHPLTANGGLGQIDPVAWGQMVDTKPSLHSRYIPADNIMAAAMYLAAKAGGSLPADYAGWIDLYNAAYRG